MEYGKNSRIDEIILGNRCYLTSLKLNPILDDISMIGGTLMEQRAELIVTQKCNKKEKRKTGIKNSKIKTENDSFFFSLYLPFIHYQRITFFYKSAVMVYLTQE